MLLVRHVTDFFSPPQFPQRMLRALLYSYVLGGVTFIPLLFLSAIFFTFYTSVPVGDAHVTETKSELEADSERVDKSNVDSEETTANHLPRTRKGWLTVRRTFQETAGDGSYVTLVRSFLDSRSKDPKRSRPKDMWYVVLKGTVLYLYEDEEMSECEAAIELSQHQILIYPERLPDAELFAKRNAICLRQKLSGRIPSLSGEMHVQPESVEHLAATEEQLADKELQRDTLKDQAMNPSTPWFVFVRSNVDMEDWYFALIHASQQPTQTPTLSPLRDIFDPLDMNHLVSTLDEQPDVIPMRWLNALLGRIFFSHYRTQALESYIIGRFMKKLSKVKRPAFLTEVAVTNVSVGKRAPMFSKPMLKELTKEGDASVEVHLQYRGEIRITVEATAVINLGARFKSYTVKLVLAAVLKELEGNLLIRVKRPPSNRIWYAFTQTPRMVMEVEPIVSDRQITWGMILSTIETKFKEIVGTSLFLISAFLSQYQIQESIVMPNMDDIAFFDTTPYELRGGIWSDARRKSPVSSSATFTKQEELHPLVSTDTTTSSESLQKGDDASIQSAPAAMSAPMEVSSSDVNDSFGSENSTKRRTRLSSTINNELDTASTPNIVLGSFSDKSEDRNVSQESEVLSGTHTTFSSDPPKAVADVFMERTTTRSTSSHRSVSQHSVEVPHNLVDQEVHKFPTPRKNSDASASVQPPSPPSFFDTLKARTADKQAIKETAKEAIRKWGVNWGSFKRDNAIGPGQSDDNFGGNINRSGSPQEGGSKTSTQNPRTSYAEVRAAVTERKERERTSQLLDHETGPPRDFPSLPETSRSRTQSTLSTNFDASDAVALARLPSLATKKSISQMITEQDVPYQDRISEDPIKSVPIHVQPVPKTMSIPGIHVSHRGELQSMGFVAPQTQPTVPSGPVSETVLKNPAIQTVYRFLKSNGDRKLDSSEPLVRSPSYQFDDSSQLSSLVSPAESLDNQTTGSEVLPHSVVTPQLTLKPTPPPLPPRSISGTHHESFSLPSGSNSLGNTVGTEEYIQINNVLTPEEPILGSARVFTRPNIDVSRTDLEETGTTAKAFPPPLPPRRTPVPMFHDTST